MDWNWEFYRPYLGKMAPVWELNHKSIRGCSKKLMVAKPSTGDVIKVIEGVYAGAIALDDAERWARQSGLFPSVIASLDVNNLTVCARWPILLAISSILSGGPEAGISSWKGYKFRDPGLPPQPEWINAAMDLKRPLAEGKITAWGIKLETLQRVLVPPAEWNDLVVQRYRQVGNASFDHEEQPRYLDVLLNAKEFHNWNRTSAGIQKARTTIDSETACTRELMRLMKSHPNEPIPKSEIRKKFPLVSAKGFDRAFAAAVREAGTPAWSAPGRRRSKS